MNFSDWFNSYISPDCPNTNAWVVCNTNGILFIQLSIIAICSIIIILDIGLSPKVNNRRV